MFELTVILKKDDATYKQKFLCYEPFTIHPGNAELGMYIDDAKKQFMQEPDEIKIRITMQVL